MSASASVRAVPVRRLLAARRSCSSFWKRSRSSATSIMSGRGADDRHAVGLEVARQLQRRLPAELDDHAVGLLVVDDLEHVFERQRLEIEAVGGVVVGGHRLRIAVDHDGLVAVLAQRQRGVHAAVVELDALADAVGAAAEDHDLLARRSARPRTPPRRSSTCRRCGSRTRRRRCPRACTPGARRGRGAARAPRLRPVVQQAAPGAGRRSPCASGRAAARAESSSSACLRPRACSVSHDLLDLREEPGIDRGLLGNLLERHADAEGVGHVPDALRPGVAELVGDAPRGSARALDRSRRRRSRGRAAPSAATPGRCGRWPSPRRPTSSAWSGGRRPGGNFSKAKRGTLVTT